MEGDVGKKSIHIRDSFLHLNYIGIMTNQYSINIVYVAICILLLLHADSDVTTAKPKTLNGHCVNNLSSVYR